jgi:hypothetical protein
MIIEKMLELQLLRMYLADENIPALLNYKSETYNAMSARAEELEEEFLNQYRK